MEKEGFYSGSLTLGILVDYTVKQIGPTFMVRLGENLNLYYCLKDHKNFLLDYGHKP